MIKLYIQYLAIGCFIALGIIDACSKPPQYDFAGLNFSLVMLYVFLYIQPFGRVFK